MSSEGPPPVPPPPEVLAALAAEPLPFANKSGNMYALVITLTVLLWICTIGRIWTRFIVVKKPWWDDIFAVIAVLMFTMCQIEICIMVHYGLGKHAALITPHQLEMVLLNQWVWGIGYAASAATVKLSLLFQYIRVYQPGMITYRCTQALLIVTALWGFALTFISTFVCFPSPSAFWKRQPRGCYGFAATDINELTGTIKGHSGSNFFLDVLVLCLAVRLQFLKDEQTNKKSMFAILFMGTLACGFALWRFIEIIITGGGVGVDPTWNMPGPGMLSTVEIFLSALCATIPFFWPAVRDQFSKIFVQYDFNVSESRVHQQHDSVEGYELTKSGTLPAGVRPNEPWVEETWPPEKTAQTSVSGKPAFREEFADGRLTSYEIDDQHMYQGGNTDNVKSSGIRYN